MTLQFFMALAQKEKSDRDQTTAKKTKRSQTKREKTKQQNHTTTCRSGG
jgi:hypothetical protein